LISSVPQGILALTFTNKAINSWFSPQLGNAIEGGVNLALTYSQEIDRALQSLNDSNIYQGYLRFIEISPQSIWVNISDVSIHVHSLQIFYADDREDFFTGNPVLKLNAAPMAGIDNGLLPKEFRNTLTIQRAIKSYPVGGQVHRIILSSLYPIDFTTQARDLTSAMRTYNQIEEFRTVYRTALILFYSFFTIPIMLLSFLISFFLSDEITLPIVNLENATRRVMEGDYSFRLIGRRNSVLSILVASFNNMIAELENSRTKMIQTEKVTAWQEIAQRLAHEIKNPLTPIKLSAERIRRRMNDDPAQLTKIVNTSVDSIIREVESLNHLLAEFRSFARMPSLNPRQIQLEELLLQCLAGYRRPGIEVSTDGINKTVSVPADREQLKIVFSNLIKNAFDSMGDTGALILRTDLVRKGNSQYCRVQIEDTGCGMDAETQKQVFHPYFTTKKDGTGLGLPIVERIVFDHRGQIWLESQPGIGTTFFIDLPMERIDGHHSDNRR
ncbi:MAG: two-component sensor histidine kinase, partial [Spirochaetales bacterium]|nr:two-component sensor histidine kinase [Spirochaetales bacterium]